MLDAWMPSFGSGITSGSFQRRISLSCPQPDQYILWNNYYDYQFTNADKVDFFIVATDEALAEFLEAGYSHQNALDVVLGVSLASLCNYANNLADTPINPELQPYA